MTGIEGINAERPGTILLQSGRYFDLAAPEESSFTIEDIAHALARLCRFTGHTRSFYSVAEHSVWASQLVPPQDALAALLHDASEAFVGDVSRPLKALVPQFRAIEKRIEAVVLARFGIHELPPSVKQADMAMLRIEQEQAMRNSDAWSGLEGIRLAPVELRFWSPAKAEAAFLERFETLSWADG